MAIEKSVGLQPFMTPNFVIAKLPAGRNGGQDAPKWHLGEISAETLSDLCDVFRAEIFAKAGKSDPKAGASR